MPIGNAANGMCGGMVYTVRDYFEAGSPPPPNTAPPQSGPLFNHLSNRLFDSFSLPGGPMKYLHLMNPDLPDHETDFSRLGLLPHGRAWVMIVEEWPQIRADIDSGRLSPMALIRVKSHDPFQMGQNHQVLAYAYRLNGSDLKIYVYDPNYPTNDKVTISLNISDPQHTTDITYSIGGTTYAFFRTGYGYSTPPGFAVPATKLAGDFNNDGKTDVALAGGQGWGSLPVAFSTGGGAFTVTNNAITDFATWASDRNAKKLMGDFNNDGMADVALTGPGYWRSVPTALSQGNGSFTVINAWVGDFAIWSADREAEQLVGDFDGDGDSDIALSGSPYWNTLPVAFSNGNGAYNVTNMYIGDFATWSSNLEVKRLVGDFDGDGLDDIALTGPSEWGSVPVALSNGNGSFTVVNAYIGAFASWSAHPYVSRLVGDFNGDSRDGHRAHRHPGLGQRGDRLLGRRGRLQRHELDHPRVVRRPERAGIRAGDRRLQLRQPHRHRPAARRLRHDPHDRVCERQRDLQRRPPVRSARLDGTSSIRPRPCCSRATSPAMASRISR